MFYYWRRAIIGDCAYIRDNTVFAEQCARCDLGREMAHLQCVSKIQTRDFIKPLGQHLCHIKSVITSKLGVCYPIALKKSI